MSQPYYARSFKVLLRDILQIPPIRFLEILLPRCFLITKYTLLQEVREGANY